MMTNDEIASQYADAMVKSWFNNRLDPGSSVPVDPDHLERTKNRFRGMAHELMQEIQIKDLLWDRMRNGRFHPDNKASRRLFTQFTGVELPSTVSGTVQMIRQYLGEDWCKAKAAEELAKSQADEAAYQAEFQRQCKERIEAMLDKMPCRVTGDQLIEMARHLEIPVHPRTVGVLRQVTWLWKDGKQYYAEHRKRKLALQGAVDVYYEVCCKAGKIEVTS